MLNFYDFEVFKEDWIVCIVNPVDKTEHTICNDSEVLIKYWEDHKDEIWVGYNSRHYDQWILKAIICGFDPKKVNDYIIEGGNKGWQFSPLLRKVELNDYDVFHRATDRGLKTHEGFMGNDIRETTVPFDIDRKLTPTELAEVIYYCKHDVDQTMQVFLNRKNEFDARMGLIKMFDLPLSYISKTDAQLTAIVLEANRPSESRDDEFDIEFASTLRLDKYSYVLDWYKDPSNLDYAKSLETDVAGVPHIFAWGGIHGARQRYSSKGFFVNMDVTSYYPSMMIEYGWLSRNVSDPKKFEEIRDTRVKYKAAKDPRQEPLKNVINGTFGASKDKYNNLFDPRQANNVCVNGQLLLLDLMEKLEGHCEIIQSNTDGILVKLYDRSDFHLIDDIAWEWEERTGMRLEFDIFTRVFQKDVNNYVMVAEDGSFKTKGAYTKKLNNLDYDLAIVNKAVVDYMVKGTPIEETVMACTDLRDFQKVVKISGKYLYGLHNGQKLTDKTFRVFASKDKSDTTIRKVKSLDKNPEKFGNTPDHCFIYNESVIGKPLPEKLDKQWYIDLAHERLVQFGVE